MFFTKPEDFKKRELSPKVTSQIVWGERITLSYVSIEPNNPIPPLHKHPHEQMGMVLEGEVGLTIGEETRILKKGDAFLIPPNVPHGLSAPSKKPARVLDIFSPPREDFKK